MGNKPDQSSMFRLPKGTVHSHVPGGGKVASGYGKQPVECTFNPDRSQIVKRDPQQGNKK